MLWYLSENFHTKRRRKILDSAETVLGIYVGEIGKLGILVRGASLHNFQKRSTLDSSA